MSDPSSSNAVNALTSRAVEVLHNPVTAWVILVCGLVVTGAAGLVSTRALERRAQERFETRTLEITDAVEARMMMYEQVLWGGVGLFNGTGRQPTREEFRDYVATLDINDHWPGIQGIGFSVPVAPEERDAHVAEIRAQGFPDFAISPEGVREQYSSIVYLEPFDWRNQRAFGYDMWSNDLRREAMARARDTGMAATSGVITLVQETEEDTQRGFLTYVPVYRPGAPTGTLEERQDAFVGWVYSPFRMGDLMAGILGSAVWSDDNVEYEIFGGPVSSETLLYDSNETYSGMTPPADARFSDEAHIDIQGRTWRVEFASGSGYLSVGERRQPMLIMFAGVVIDLLLFYVVSALAFLQRRARKLAASMTVDLRAAKAEVERKAAQLEVHAARLQTSNTELERFAYIASHDLQEPIRSIRSFAELLEAEYGDRLDDRGTRWLGHMNESAGRMRALVDDLLAFCRLDSSGEVLRDVSLGAALDDALENLRSAIAQTNAIIEREPLPTIHGDPVQLQQVFQNLVGNAITYRSPETRPIVRIAAEPEGDGWKITVQDNGIGIKPQYHERIFEMFKRLGSRTEYPGTGIGLAVCRRIVERHGGTIGVDSELGAGSTFWFTLKTRVERAPSDGASEGGEPAGSGEVAGGGDTASGSPDTSPGGPRTEPGTGSGRTHEPAESWS